MRSPCRVLAAEKNLDYRGVCVEAAAVVGMVAEEQRKLRRPAIARTAVRMAALVGPAITKDANRYQSAPFV